MRARQPGEHERRLGRAARDGVPLSEHVGDVLGQMNLALLVVLRCRTMPVGDGVADVDDAAEELDVRPGEREQLPLAHPGLERRQEERPVHVRDVRDPLGELRE